MLLIAPRKRAYWTHRLALMDAARIAENTGLRQRVEICPRPCGMGSVRYRIVPVKPVVR
jgi:hypothetical protein